MKKLGLFMMTTLCVMGLTGCGQRVKKEAPASNVTVRVAERQTNDRQ